MKRLTTLALAFPIAFWSCTPKTSNEVSQEKPINLEGVWEMTDLYTYTPQGDSTKVPMDGNRQVKMYSQGYVMWSRTVPIDSTQWYGWGKYSVEDGMLKEWIEYGSHAFMKLADPAIPFEHKVVQNGTIYVQTRFNEKGEKLAAEFYTLISREEDEPQDDVYPSLQGVWEMVKLEDNQNGQLVPVDRTGYRQIKMYEDGYVMWSQMVPDDSTEWFGFGKYSANGGILTEWMEFGSHSFMPAIGEEPFIQELNFSNGNYVQILKDENGNEDVKEYYTKIGEKQKEGTGSGSL